MSADKPASITEWLQNLPISWLVSDSAEVTSYGTVLDGQASLVKQAIKARMPTQAPSDALAHIGNERGLIQQGTIAGAAESNTAFGLRLRKVWDNDWPAAGTPASILMELYRALGYTNAYIVQQNGVLYSLTTPSAADPRDGVTVTATMTTPVAISPGPGATKTIPINSPWWTFDTNTDFCSRFAVLFPGSLPASWTSILNPPTGVSAPSLSEVNAIRSIIAQFKNAEATCMGIYVLKTGKMIGYPTSHTLGDGTRTLGGTTTIFTP